MTTSTFSCFSSVFGFIVAAISFFAFIINIWRSHLPSNKIKVLESLLDETETYFKKAVEEGLLTELTFVHRTERRLAMSMPSVHCPDLALTSYPQIEVTAINLRQDYVEFFRGTSTAIGTACQTLKKLRAQVITSSEQGRLRRLEEMQSPHCNSLPTSTLFIHSQGECHPSDPEYAPEVPRPSSCPPVFVKWKPADMRRIFAQSNPPRNLTQSDLDVRTADAQTCASTVHTSVTLEPGA
ncbi:hypothetical protein JVT61DRAFT_10920 [Boletus reticuloceps]|uniref:Uncharacterized protein n=1 Tax=Boletus reticuloceps TaxID=495285 RepID=A0A8I2YFI6_9AGAM|nr:hypothetical protein JVT61DRAFT_10920 [Boletus reticuloceps]